MNLNTGKNTKFTKLVTLRRIFLLSACSLWEKDLLVTKYGSTKCDPHNTFLKVNQAHGGAFYCKLKKVSFDIVINGTKERFFGMFDPKKLFFSEIRIILFILG